MLLWYNITLFICLFLCTCSFYLYTLLLYVCTGDNVKQQPGAVIVTEGGLVTLSCQYNTSANNAYLYWYKQEANDVPKHMLSRYSFGSGDNERFDALLDKDSTSVPLTIQRLQPSYSAVYYCALRDKDCDNSVTTGYTAPLQKLFDSPQSPGDVIATEGEQVTLDFQFETQMDMNLNLFWYKQGANTFPKYMRLLDQIMPLNSMRDSMPISI
uniref:Ig-like domain-containing protein n=1 Tax=Salmo trutta TaxID=8032 RepID=A0A674BDV3_SALTR